LPSSSSVVFISLPLSFLFSVFLLALFQFLFLGLLSPFPSHPSSDYPLFPPPLLPILLSLPFTSPALLFIFFPFSPSFPSPSCNYAGTVLLGSNGRE
jgi:hypothetical protein